MANSPTPGKRGPTTGSPSTSRKIVMLLLLLIVTAVLFTVFVMPRFTSVPPSSSPSFFASIDTMKESRDTETHPLSWQAITNIVNLSASLKNNYITVDTEWNYPNYMQQWIAAVRASGHHVWFRIFPHQWERSDSVTDIMTPVQYESSEWSFISSHPSFFRPGDILDPCPEPENGQYWLATYGEHWSNHAPNQATDDFNSFLIDLTTTANQAFQQLGIKGVITTVHSLDPWAAEHTQMLYQSTVQQLGNLVTVDGYPDQYTIDPVTAANAWLEQLMRIHDAHPTARILIGEMGYSNKINVNDATQQAVLKAELDAIAPLPYLAGVNYWVGPGTQWSGGYTHIFVKSGSTWSLRPAALELSKFYETKLYGNTQDHLQLLQTLAFYCTIYPQTHIAT